MTWTPPTNIDLNALKGFWAKTPPELRSLLTPVQKDEPHGIALQAFEQLLSDSQTGEDVPVQTLELLHLLGEHLHAYETRSLLPAVEGREVLRFLMEQHKLRQSDLPEVASQGVISELLSGRRTLNMRQAKALAAQFNVAYTVFLT